jgi:hypothetical protein
MVYDSNSFLSLDEMTVNAQYILDFLLGQGWTKNAVCGLLGNLQTESSINFGIWEGLNAGNTSGGFGLTQWTPATKYLDWASANGYANDHVIGELQRILWEVENNQQWFGGVSSQMTFKQWTQSTDTPYNLAMDFIATYEHPANPNQPDRGNQATYWFNTLTGSGGVIEPPPPVFTPNNADIMHLLLSDCLNGWKW